MWKKMKMALEQPRLRRALLLVVGLIVGFAGGVITVYTLANFGVTDGWDAVGAVGNIAAAIGTFLAVAAALHIARGDARRLDDRVSTRRFSLARILAPSMQNWRRCLTHQSSKSLAEASAWGHPYQILIAVPPLVEKHMRELDDLGRDVAADIYLAISRQAVVCGYFQNQPMCESLLRFLENKQQPDDTPRLRTHVQLTSDFKEMARAVHDASWKIDAILREAGVEVLEVPDIDPEDMRALLKRRAGVRLADEL